MTTEQAIVPPQNLEAEESVLGAMMLDPRAIEAVSGLVTPDDFYRESHAKIFRAACAMHDRGETVDAITLYDYLDTLGLVKDVGGKSRIHELAALQPTMSNAGHYAQIVNEQAALRRLIHAGMNITRLGYERPGELPELIAQAEACLSDAVDRTALAKATTMLDDLDALVAEIREAYVTETPIFGLRTGYASIDEKLSGFWPGQLVLCAARPGRGKSALALNIAENIADRNQHVLFNTLEMSKYELQIRSLSRAASVNSRHLMTGQLTKEDAQKLGACLPAVRKRSAILHVQDSGAMTVATLKAEARRLRRQEDLQLIVVDYLQLMQGGGEGNRNEQVSVISRSLKLLARELGVPILALSQMSRAIESRNEKRPTLADLRDSGSLEQDADVVMFIHTDTDYDPNLEADGTMEVIIEKNRKGERGTVKLAFNGKNTRFMEMPK